MDIISTRASRSNRRAMMAEDIKVERNNATFSSGYKPQHIVLEDSQTFCTCHDSRWYGSDSRTSLGSDFGQRLEKQPVSCHGKEHPRHWEHGAQQAAEKNAIRVKQQHYYGCLGLTNRKTDCSHWFCLIWIKVTWSAFFILTPEQTDMSSVHYFFRVFFYFCDCQQ